MRSYATEIDVRKYLDTDSCSSERVEFFLDKTTGEIDSMIGDLKLSDKKEYVELDAITNKGDLFLRNQNVVSIKKINGKDYVGVKDKDYFVLRPQNRKVRIVDLQNYLSDAYTSGVFTIEYESGYDYDTMPEDLKLAQCLLVAYYFMREEGKDIVKYVMGPRTVQYGDSSDILADAKKILNKYKQINLLP